MRSVTMMAAWSALRVVMSMVHTGQPGSGVGVVVRLGLGGAGLALEPAVPAPGGQAGRDHRRVPLRMTARAGWSEPWLSWMMTSQLMPPMRCRIKLAGR